MDTRKEPRVVAVDRFDGGVIVSFADHRDAVYPARFLYDSLPLVQELHESELNPEGSENTSSDGDGSVTPDSYPPRM